MINAVESNSEEIHGRSEKIKLKERAESDLMAANEDFSDDVRVFGIRQQSSKLLDVPACRANVTPLSPPLDISVPMRKIVTELYSNHRKLSE